MSTRHAYATEVQAEINVTPLVDVMLALVVILIVTAPLAMHRIALPIGGPGVDSAARTLAVSVKSTGELYLDGVGVNRAQLAAAFASAASAARPPTLDVKPDASASYESVATVLALAQSNGVPAIRVEGAAATD
jgi:biopolymer transport protein ExbD